MNKYYNKYLKYKNKYLTLKKILGGTIDNIAIYGSAFTDNDFSMLPDIADKHQKVYIGLFYSSKNETKYNEKFKMISDFISERNITNIIIVKTNNEANPVKNCLTKFLIGYYNNEKINLTIYYKPRNIDYNNDLEIFIRNSLEIYKNIIFDIKSTETLLFVTFAEIHKKFKNIKITNEIKKQINILGYSGCFCPPHKGHFDNIINNIDKYDMVYLGIFNPEGENSPSRHGTPPIFAYQQFIKWIKSKNLQDKIKIILCNIDENPLYCIQDKLIELSQNNTNNNYNIIQIVGDELSYSPERIQKIINRFNLINQNSAISYDIKKVPRDTSVSATNFIKCLNDYKLDPKINCKHYLPEHLSDDDKNDYIKTVSQYDIY
jgi:hypothetical protein